jgi:hypothetical protein
VKETRYHIGIEIDRLTNSITNTISGDSFPTEILPVIRSDLKSITKKAGWKFNWKAEAASADREVYKLTIEGNPNIVQGLISLTDRQDHIFFTWLKARGATHVGGHRMVIYTDEAKKLINRYVNSK